MQKIRLRCRFAAVSIILILAVLFVSPSVYAFAEYDGDGTIALNNAIAYCEGHDFDTTMSGKVTARVFGIPYTQKATGARSVRGGDVVDRVESSSALVKAAIKKTYSDGKYYCAKGEHKKGGVVYGDDKELSQAEYTQSYGRPAIGLTKYELTNAVLSSNKKSDNVFEYVLDPSRATIYTRNEVKAALESKSYPEYESITLTLTTDGDRPVSVTISEIFRVDKFGGAKVVTEYTETFTFLD